MIFAPESIASSKAGRKTNTRRPCKKGDTHRAWVDVGAMVYGGSSAVLTAKGRLKWEVGRTYAMNPPPPKGCKGRMGKQEGRLLLNGIRCERVCDISDEDAMAEGVVLVDDWLPTVPAEERWKMAYCISFKRVHFYGPTPREAFLAGWKKFYKTDLTELVWVLEYEMVKS